MSFVTGDTEAQIRSWQTEMRGVHDWWWDFEISPPARSDIFCKFTYIAYVTQTENAKKAYSFPVRDLK